MKRAILSILVGILMMSAEAKELHPDFPVVHGKYQMTKNWGLELPLQFNRRFEDGSLVLWRPGITIWVDARGNDHNESIESRIEWLRSVMSKDAYDVSDTNAGSLRLLSYRLSEPAEDERVPGFYGFAVSESGHINLSIYFDKESDIGLAHKIFSSLIYEPGT